MEKKRRAPEGLYTFSEAVKRSGIARSTFIWMVEKGKIPKIVPPGRSQGYYPKKFIDEMGDATQLFALQYAGGESTEFGIAQDSDAQGIEDVVAALWGREVATPADTRIRWYAKNPMIDFVVRANGIVVGYFNIMPLRPEILAALLAGKKRGMDISPHDLYLFIPGRTYDCFVGVAVRQDIPRAEQYAARLLVGVMRILEEWAMQGIILHRLYAISDQEDGIKICKDLGFESEALGDVFGHEKMTYLLTLDLETAQSPFAERYRAAQES